MIRTRKYAAVVGGCLALCLLTAGCGTKMPDGSKMSAADPAASATETAREKTAAAAYNLYLSAEENCKMQASFDATMEGSVTIAYQGEETVMQLSVDTQLAGSPNQPQVYSRFSLTDGVNTSAHTVYYRDDKCYYADDTQRYFEHADATLATQEANMLLPVHMTSAAFENASIARQNGLTTVSMSVKGDVLEGSLLSEEGLLCALLGYAPDTGEESTSLSDVQVFFTVNENGYYTEHRISYSLTESVGDSPMTVKLDLHVTFRHPGEPTVISFPDFSAYEDKSIGNSLDQETLNAVTAVLDTLYDDSGAKVDDFDSRYGALCRQYGKDAVDAAIAWYENYQKEHTPLATGQAG